MNMQIDLSRAKASHNKYKAQNDVSFGANLKLGKHYSRKLKRSEKTFLKKINSVKDDFAKQTSCDVDGALKIIKDQGFVKRNSKTNDVSGQLSMLCSYSDGSSSKNKLCNFFLPEKDLNIKLDKTAFLSATIENDQALKRQILNKYANKDLLDVLVKVDKMLSSKQ